MSNPDLPPDSITTLPFEQRTAAIRQRHAAFAYSGATAADRERDTVIGHLLDRIDAAERKAAENAAATVSVTQGLVDLFAQHLDEGEEARQ